jgi:hypothetical protein
MVGFLSRYEWLGTLGMARRRFALRVDGEISSVVGFGPLGSHTAFRALLPRRLACRVVQLVRGATAPWAHEHSPSHLIALATRQLAQEYGVVAIAAFADPRAGEVGTIYQACNAIYLGMTSTGGAEAFIIHGKRYSARRAYEHFGSTAHDHLRKIDPKALQILRARKHRYIIPTGDRRTRALIRQLLAPFAKPYPKRRESMIAYSEVICSARPLRRPVEDRRSRQNRKRMRDSA